MRNVVGESFASHGLQQLWQTFSGILWIAYSPAAPSQLFFSASQTLLDIDITSVPVDILFTANTQACVQTPQVT